MQEKMTKKRRNESVLLIWTDPILSVLETFVFVHPSCFYRQAWWDTVFIFRLVKKTSCFIQIKREWDIICLLVNLF